MHILHLKRYLYTKQTTIGKLYINDKFFGYTLEDTVRAYGVKVPRHTAIPEGRYKIDMGHSTRFQRDMVTVYTEDDLITIKQGGIEFAGVRFHGGNDHTDTEGCPLIARNLVNDHTIQGTLEKELTAKVAELQETCGVELIVVNLPTNY